jgi:hypothetical protein
MAARERALVLDPATLENLKTFKAALGERRRLQRTDISKGSKSEL